MHQDYVKSVSLWSGENKKALCPYVVIWTLFLIHNAWQVSYRLFILAHPLAQALISDIVRPTIKIVFIIFVAFVGNFESGA